MKRIIIALLLTLGLTAGAAAQAEASTNYQSGRCWPSGANSSASLVASSWWYDPPLYGKVYHVGMTSAWVGGYYFGRKSIYIPNYGYASNLSDFTVGIGTHANGYVVGTWNVSTVDGFVATRTCRIYL